LKRLAELLCLSVQVCDFSRGCAFKSSVTVESFSNGFGVIPNLPLDACVSKEKL